MNEPKNGHVRKDLGDGRTHVIDSWCDAAGSHREEYVIHPTGAMNGMCITGYKYSREDALIATASRSGTRKRSVLPRVLDFATKGIGLF